MFTRATLLRLVLAVPCCLVAAPLAACPFCGVVGQSLAERRDEAAAVAVGEALGNVTVDGNGLPTQRFRVHQLLRGQAADVGGTVVARVVGAVSGSAVLFGKGNGRDEDIVWSAVAADESLLGHVAAAPAWSNPAAERLRWYAGRLEHPDPAIAADAFTEFGLAPYAAVRTASEAFDPERLRAWVGEPGIDQRRRGFYGLALGMAAASAADPADRATSIAALEAAIDAPADDFRAGFDGLMAGLLVAEGPRGLDALERRGLFARDARPVDQRHVLATLRFAWEELGDTIPRQQIAAATAKLVASPVTAADATIDLARYQAWDHAAAVAALWDSLGGDDPLVRRAVAGYLSACPLPEAKTLLEGIRQRDPVRLGTALEALMLPK